MRLFFLAASLLLGLSFSAKAGDHDDTKLKTYYTCKLHTISDDAEEFSITGRIEIQKLNTGRFVLSGEYTVTADDEVSTEIIESETLLDSHQSKEDVLRSEEWGILKELFGQEQPKGAHVFQTEGMEDDGSGYAVNIVHGENGNKISVVFLGWLSAVCR